ncbi:hypothetical protein DMENIID0001_021560 [Sergentomyia squamirostris]
MILPYILAMGEKILQRSRRGQKQHHGGMQKMDDKSGWSMEGSIKFTATFRDKAKHAIALHSDITFTHPTLSCSFCSEKQDASVCAPRCPCPPHCGALSMHLNRFIIGFRFRGRIAVD